MNKRSYQDLPELMENGVMAVGRCSLCGILLAMARGSEPAEEDYVQDAAREAGTYD